MRARGRGLAAAVTAVCAVLAGSTAAQAGDVGPGTPGQVTVATDLAAGAVLRASTDAARGDRSDGSPDFVRRNLHFITYVYRDLLGRDPDDAGLRAWISALFWVPPSEVAVAISHSREYRERLVTGVYERYLGRAPDPAGLKGWADAMERGWTVARIEAGFLASEELYARAGGTHAGWVTELYRTVLGREAAPSEIDAWARVLARGGTRYDVAMGFLLSWERLSAVVDGYYVTLLRRHLDPVGQRSWVLALQAGHQDEEIIAGIIGSREYWDLTAVFPVSDLALTPRDQQVQAGQPLAFHVQGIGTGDDLGDVSAQATVTVDGQPCPGAVCTVTTAGRYTVSARLGDGFTVTNLEVVPADLARVALSPSEVTIADGASHVFRAEGFDEYGNTRGDATAEVQLAVDGDPAACQGARCRPVGTGDHVVTAVGLDGSAALTMTAPGPEGAALWAWGSNLYRVMGDDTPTLRLVPTQVGDATTWSDIALGTRHAVGLRTDGSLWAWGDNTFCNLGGGRDDVDPWRSRAEQVGTDMDWVDVAAGGGLSFAIKADGTLWGFGDSVAGALGIADSNLKCEPFPIGRERRWSSVSTSGANTLAVAADGSLWGWGANASGQLGVGTTARHLVPTLVDAGPWTQVSTSSTHSLGLKADGSLWAWGSNVLGALGDGTRVSSLVPVRVGAGSDWVAIAAAPSVSLALKADGTLWAWGNDTKVGPGGPLPGVPTQTEPGRTWSAVSSTTYHRMVLADDGTLWGWGLNTAGELGNGTQVSGPTLVQAGTGDGWLAAVAGPSGVTLALRDPSAAP